MSEIIVAVLWYIVDTIRWSSAAKLWSAATIPIGGKSKAPANTAGASCRYSPERRLWHLCNHRKQRPSIFCLVWNFVGRTIFDRYCTVGETDLVALLTNPC